MSNPRKHLRLVAWNSYEGPLLGVLVALSATTATGCILPYALPPMRLEGALSTQRGNGSAAPSAAGGIHLASAVPDVTFPFDVGLGWGIGNNSKISAHGPYLEADWIQPRTNYRFSYGARGEVLTSSGRSFGYTGVLRFGVEYARPIAGPLESIKSCSIVDSYAKGLMALGGYVDIGTQKFPGSEPAMIARVGITLRIPTSAGIWVGLPCR